MRTPTLYGPFTFSVFLHASLVILFMIILRHAHFERTPVPYIVALVDEGGLISSPKTGVQKSDRNDTVPPAEKQQQPILQPPKQKAVEQARKDAEQAKKEKEHLMKERISALEAKKKIEKLAALRKIVDIDASARNAGKTLSSRSKSAQSGGVKGNAGADYYSIVIAMIRQQWIFPETVDKDLETVVSIRIARDGRVIIEKVEKSSNNPLFDRSVLRAISMASPLPPPQQEMEIGVRFRP
jgi:colicin import membrane protein